jgi:hypothetical protein
MHGNKEIVNMCNTKFLGLTSDNTFSWKAHIDTDLLKLSSPAYTIEHLSLSVPENIEDGKLFIFSLIYDLWKFLL